MRFYKPVSIGMRKYVANSYRCQQLVSHQHIQSPLGKEFLKYLNVSAFKIAKKWHQCYHVKIDELYVHRHVASKETMKARSNYRSRNWFQAPGYLPVCEVLYRSTCQKPFVRFFVAKLWAAVGRMRTRVDKDLLRAYSANQSRCTKEQDRWITILQQHADLCAVSGSQRRQVSAVEL